MTKYLVLILWFTLLFVTSCIDTKVQIVAQEVDGIRHTLHTPEDAVLLQESKRTDALIYARGCTGVVVKLIYGINRPLADVIEEYHQALTTSGWELNPAYSSKKTDKVAFYRKDIKTDLGIHSSQTQDVIDHNQQNFITVYTVTLLYTDPSNDNCIG